MKGIIKFMAAAGLAVGVSGCAAGMEGPLETGFGDAPRVCSNFGMVDRNNNGIITQAEWGGFRTGVFNDWDANNDNRLSRAEFEQCWRGGGFRNDAGFEGDDWDDNFGVFDDDGDGFLSDDEFFGDDEFGVFDEDDDFGIETGLGEWGI